ncbi:hypothetical protein IWQ60_009178 [Tieghemiomyces parasiticus]|uniref:BHLH domain-containing protein n=1 Tax=Tieghemiomyces parasiticus TaxID=78921 RepID=A0A9W8DQK1_9FUNG|nr:hypothetical protein IWQ60_009178 [Tieghemiomyces parasiticus]
MSDLSAEEYEHNSATGPPTRKKRKNHNELERRRRHHQRDVLYQLRDVVPSLHAAKPSSVIIMQKAKEYIDMLHLAIQTLEMEGNNLRQHLYMATKQPIPPRPPVLAEIAANFSRANEYLTGGAPTPTANLYRPPAVTVGPGVPGMATIAPRMPEGPPGLGTFPPSPGFYPPSGPPGTLGPFPPGSSTHPPGGASGVGAYALSPLSPRPFDTTGSPQAMRTVEALSLAPAQPSPDASVLMPPPPAPLPRPATPPIKAEDLVTSSPPPTASTDDLAQVREENAALRQRLADLEKALAERGPRPGPSLQDVAQLLRKRKSVVDSEYGALQQGLADRRNSQLDTWESMKLQSQTLHDQLKNETSGKYHFDKKPSLPTSRLTGYNESPAGDTDPPFGTELGYEAP